MNAEFYNGALGREGDNYFLNCHLCPILNSDTLGIVFESPYYSAEKRQEPCYNWLFEDVVDIRGYYKRAGSAYRDGKGSIFEMETEMRLDTNRCINCGYKTWGL